MKVYLGKSGLHKTWQKPFPEIQECHKCKKEARIMFVGYEDYGADKKEYICKLRSNGGQGDYWPHDAIAVAVYLCKECFSVSGYLNQA